MKMRHDELIINLKQLRLFTVCKDYVELAKQAEKEKYTYEQYLSLLIDTEIRTKYNNRIQRLIKDAKLPFTKTLEQYDFSIRNGINDKQFQRLATGEFVKQAGNVVFYGSFGVGKTHLAILLTQLLCEQGYKCFYTSSNLLIQNLLTAKRDLELNAYLNKLDRFDLIVCDELGYLPQTQEGADLFFQLISQRAERKSLMITTNLTYSEWEKVFLNPLTTAAAVDRIIYNCQTFNIEGQSYRSIVASKRKNEKIDLTANKEITIQ